MAITGEIYGNDEVNNWLMKVVYSYTQNAQRNETYLTRSYYVYNHHASNNTDENSAYYIIEDGPKVYEKYEWEKPSYNKEQWHLLETVTSTIKHDENGKKSVTLSASWVSGHDGTGNTPKSLSVEVELELADIDLSVFSIKLKITDITAKSIDIYAEGNTIYYKWDYSVDGGLNWIESTQAASVGQCIYIDGLSPYCSYDICVRGKDSVNSYRESRIIPVTTLGASKLNTVNNITADETTVAINFNAAIYDARFYHKFIICEGDKAIVTTEAFQKTAGNNQDYTVQLTSEQQETLLKHMSNIKKFKASVSLKTYTDYYCTEQIGPESNSLCEVVTTEENSAPDFSNFTYEDSFVTTKNLIGVNGVFLQNFSMLRVNCDSASAKNFATLVSYSVSVGNVSVTSTNSTVDVGGIKSAGNLEIIVTCSDSRGYATKAKKQIVVLEYSRPKISGKIRRRNEIDEVVQLEFSGSFSSIKPDDITEKNYISDITYKYKKTNEDNSKYSTPVSILEDTNISGTMISYENIELLELDKGKSFDFIITVTDVLGITTQYEFGMLLMSANPYLILLKANTKYKFPRVGMFNPNPEYPFDCNGEANFVGNVRVDGEPLSRRIEKGTSDFWSWEKYNDGTAKCWGTYNVPNQGFSDCNNTFCYSKKDITFPSLLFSSEPTNLSVIANCLDEESMAFSSISKITKDKVTFNFLLFNIQNSSGYFNVSYIMEVKGKWKED